MGQTPCESERSEKLAKTDPLHFPSLPGTVHLFSTRSLLIIVLFQLLTLQVIEGVNPGDENMTIFQHTTNQKRERSQSHLRISVVSGEALIHRRRRSMGRKWLIHRRKSFTTLEAPNWNNSGRAGFWPRLGEVWTCHINLSSCCQCNGIHSPTIRI